MNNRTTELPGSSLGAVISRESVRFRLLSRHAAAVELCLFDSLSSPRESRRVALRRRAGDLWEVTVPDLGAGQLYGYRVDGPFAPQDGHRFNRAKLLVDPWARAITGEPTPDPALFAYEEASCPDLSFSSRDSAPVMPRCVVVDPAFDWRGDRPPRVPWSDTVVYECHVRGMTLRHPGVEPRLRGTYLGLGAAPILEHLGRLGVTAVELLPIHQIAREPHLMEKGLANYWGYSTLGYFAPHAGYATRARGEQVTEFKTMVRELHRAGIEVVLDVVYNHTAEGHHRGPTLSFRGLDNRTYYRLRERNLRRYVDYSGCGNFPDLGEPAVRELVLGSLRYWVEEMHVDGFRFDLAPALGRCGPDFDARSELFEQIRADPVLSQVKLIAEPWDLGPGGYQLGRFPALWTEWNDRYRDGVRRFWSGGGGTADFAARIAGSPDLFPDKGPLGSLHFVSCHDGFTLRDLTGYEHKHNDANLEDNRDGHGHNLSRNWGLEGPTDDPEILRIRERARRNLLATVYLSRGVPMLLYGDELGRTQRGNNNAYCQDNEISWIDWTLEPPDEIFLAFTRRLVELRRRFPSLRTRGFVPPMEWWCLDGRAAQPNDSRAFAWRLPAVSDEGDLVVLVNGSDGDVVFHPGSERRGWTELLDTSRDGSEIRSTKPPWTVAAFSLRCLTAAT